jgi:NADPH2:quinone reductase
MGGSLTTLGYSAGRKSTIDVTDLIWKRANIKSFSLFAQPPERWRAGWNAICALLESGAVKPIVARTFSLEDAAEALRYQIEADHSGGSYLACDGDWEDRA